MPITPTLAGAIAQPRGPKVNAVVLRHIGGRYLIFYRHDGEDETLVDASGAEFGEDYLMWFGAARSHARDYGVPLYDKTGEATAA